MRGRRACLRQTRLLLYYKEGGLGFDTGGFGFENTEAVLALNTAVFCAVYSLYFLP